MSGRWYCIRKVGQGTVRTDEIIKQHQEGYVAQWIPLGRAYGKADQWSTYPDSKPGTWTAAYACLERHANAADLEVNFVGTF